MSDKNDSENNTGPDGTAEPSMEEILASIRRILKEEEGQRGATDESEDDMLVLDESMVAMPGDFLKNLETLAESQLTAAIREPEREANTTPSEQAPVEPVYLSPEAADEKWSLQENEMSDTNNETVQSPEGLVGSEISTAVATTIGSLVNSINNERSVTVSRAGVTIEDIIREEIKPLLKAWLNTHLPTLVERVVRAEIARVVERTKL